MVIHHPNDGHPPSTGWSATMARKVVQHPENDRTPYPIKSPTIPRMFTHNPRTFAHQPKSGHQPSLGRLTTVLITITHHPLDGHPAYLGWSSYPTSQGRSPIITRMGTHHPHERNPQTSGHSPSLEQSPTIPWMVTHHP